MAWYFNFCSPTIPNDPTINTHRYAQTVCLILFIIIYFGIYVYYKICGPSLLEEKQIRSESEGSDGSQHNDKGSDENSEHHDEKSISIAGGLAGQDENSSYVTFTTKEYDQKTLKKGKNKKTGKKKQYEVYENVTLEEIQGYFPLVFGHYAIACAFSIMYSPYAEQSIVAFLYIVLGIVVTILNAKRKEISVRVVWAMMCFLVFFLVMSALLEVGQANFNKIEKECFSVGYKALY